MIKIKIIRGFSQAIVSCSAFYKGDLVGGYRGRVISKYPNYPLKRKSFT
ncbi:hypothetical protein HMPREF1423_00337 [Helicobacter pylori GAM270ASi]|nr:hypothetical protein HMPREF1423_00337 [Helicobacter pylori GAM270ASi]